MHNSNQLNGFKKGLLLGGLVGGTIVGLLMTEKGRMLRRNLQTDVQELAKQIQNRAKEFGDTTEEVYNELVETAVEEYAKRKDMALEMKDVIVRELKRKWWDFQVFMLFSQVKRKLTNTVEVTEDTFAELANEVVGEYAQKKGLMNYWKNKLVREVTKKWSSYSEDKNDEREEKKDAEQE